MANLAPVYSEVTGILAVTEKAGVTGDPGDAVLQGGTAISDPDGSFFSWTYPQVTDPEQVSLAWSHGTLAPSQIDALLQDNLTFGASPWGPVLIGTTWSAPEAPLDFLSAGETLTLTTVWTVSDGTDATRVPIVLTVHGSNDAPVLAQPAPGSVTEVALSTTQLTSGLSGTLSATDPDVNDTLRFAVVGTGTRWEGVVDGWSTVATVYGVLRVNENTGEYRFTPNAADVEAMGAGDVVPLRFVVSVTDAQGASDAEEMFITITGANDAPTAGPVTGTTAYTEAALTTGSPTWVALNGSVLLRDPEADYLSGSFLSGNVTSGNLTWSHGTLSAAQLDALDTILTSQHFRPVGDGQETTTKAGITWQFTDGALDFLSAGETLTLTSTYRVTDGSVSTDVPITLTVTGSNDAPTLAAIPAGTVTEVRGATGYALDQPLSGTLVGSDPEGDALTFGFGFGFGFGDAPAVNGVIESTDVRGTFRLEVATGAYSFTPSAAWVEHFRDGTVAILTVPFTVSDGQGGTAQATWDITFFGADERIVVAPVADQAAREGQAFSFTLPAGTFTDPEGDALALSATGLPSWLTFDPLTGTFSGTPPAGQGDGAVTVTVTASDGASSAVEDTAQVSFEIGVGRTLTGTKAADTLVGGRFGDFIRGLSGADSLSGLAGDDTLLGEEGADLLRGGDGEDVLAGGGATTGTGEARGRTCSCSAGWAGRTWCRTSTSRARTRTASRSTASPCAAGASGRWTGTGCSTRCCSCRAARWCCWGRGTRTSTGARC